eukprot:1569762-Pleurochrysis_carterae.AAC.4
MASWVHEVCEVSRRRVWNRLKLVKRDAIVVDIRVDDAYVAVVVILKREHNVLLVEAVNRPVPDDVNPCRENAHLLLSEAGRRSKHCKHEAHVFHHAGNSDELLERLGIAVPQPKFTLRMIDFADKTSDVLRAEELLKAGQEIDHASSFSGDRIRAGEPGDGPRSREQATQDNDGREDGAHRTGVVPVYVASAQP